MSFQIHNRLFVSRSVQGAGRMSVIQRLGVTLMASALAAASLISPAGAAGKAEQVNPAVSPPTYSWPFPSQNSALTGVSADPSLSTSNAGTMGVHWMTNAGSEVLSSSDCGLQHHIERDAGLCDHDSGIGHRLQPGDRPAGVVGQHGWFHGQLTVGRREQPVGGNAARGPNLQTRLGQWVGGVLGLVPAHIFDQFRRPRWPPLRAESRPCTSVSTTSVPRTAPSLPSMRPPAMSTSHLTPNLAPEPVASGVSSAMRWTPLANRWCCSAPPTLTRPSTPSMR